MEPILELKVEFIDW